MTKGKAPTNKAVERERNKRKAAQEAEVNKRKKRNMGRIAIMTAIPDRGAEAFEAVVCDPESEPLPEFADISEAEKWVKKHGDLDTEYVVVRVVKTLKKHTVTSTTMVEV